MRQLNFSTFEKGKKSLDIAKRRLLRTAGIKRGTMLMGLMMRGDAKNTELRIQASARYIAIVDILLYLQIEWQE